MRKWLIQTDRLTKLRIQLLRVLDLFNTIDYAFLGARHSMSTAQQISASYEVRVAVLSMSNHYQDSTLLKLET